MAARSYGQLAGFQVVILLTFGEISTAVQSRFESAYNARARPGADATRSSMSVTAKATRATANMLSMKLASIAALLLCIALSVEGAQPSDLLEPPQAIQELATRIQGKSPTEVRAAIIERFGAARRKFGSGVIIEEWDVSAGVLRFHPGVGPTFLDSKTNRHFWLLRTSNPAGSNILQGYQMFTLPIPPTTEANIGSVNSSSVLAQLIDSLIVVRGLKTAQHRLRTSSCFIVPGRLRFITSDRRRQTRALNWQEKVRLLLT